MYSGRAGSAQTIGKARGIQNPSDPNPSDPDAELVVLLPILGSDICCATWARNDARAWTRFSARTVAIKSSSLPSPHCQYHSPLKDRTRKQMSMIVLAKVRMHDSI